jgi:hypothetical protein
LQVFHSLLDETFKSNVQTIDRLVKQAASTALIGKVNVGAIHPGPEADRER